MKKLFKFFIAAIFGVFLCFALSLCCFAQDDMYISQYENSGAQELYDKLPEDAKEFFSKYNISAKDQEWQEQLDTKTVLGIIIDFLKNGVRGPVSVFACVAGMVLLCTAVSGLSEIKLQNSGVFEYVALLLTATAVLSPLHSVIKACIEAVEANGNFMLAFVPIYASITAANGGVATAAAGGSALLFATQITQSIISFIIMPICSCYLAICLCTAANPLMPKSEAADMLHKAATWVLGLTMTVFLGVLGIQTSITGAADTVSSRAVKFAVSSAIPVVGASVSEALGTVKSCISLLSTSVGIYGVIAVCVVLAPVLLQLLLWRAAVVLSMLVSELFGSTKITVILKAVDGMLAILFGIMLFCLMLFIISLTIVMRAVG